MKHLGGMAILLALLFARAESAGAQARSDTARSSADAIASVRSLAVEGVDIDEHLGRRIDTALEFTREDGARVRLADYFSDGRPVLLVLAYYRCPTLCGLVLRGVVEGLKDLDFKLGQQYRALTLSIDPRDAPEAAGQKQASTLSGLGQPDMAAAWPFLIGEEAASRALADALGFRFTYDASTDQYAHPAVLFALTPDGRISRYLYGVHFSARDLRLSLIEAGQGKTGSIVDRVLLTCYRYDPSSRRYDPYIFGFMRLGAIVILAVIAGMLGLLWRGERRRRAARGR
jgi:protein SCO1